MMKEYFYGENDLIRRVDAIKAYCKSFCTPGILCPDAYCKEPCEAFGAIPAVDAVQVVRCRDCKFATMTADRKLAKRCSQWAEMGDLYIDADFFCACGQRRE